MYMIKNLNEIEWAITKANMLMEVAKEYAYEHDGRDNPEVCSNVAVIVEAAQESVKSALDLLSGEA